MTLLFWGSIALMVYAFIGYPIALAACAAMRTRSWRRERIEPSISIVIAAHNEAAAVIPKINNLLSLDYPAGKFEILIGSDGSTDGTAEQLLCFNDARVRAFIFPQRRGKPAVLNTLLPKATGDIVVLADVRQTFDVNVLRALSQSFADPEVGAVTGELLLTRDGTSAAVGEGSGFYWRYEKFIRSRECAIGSTIVVTGAIYAIRRELFEAIPHDTICDDLLVPLRIARRGYRVVFEREARAYDVPPMTAGQEFTRKVRTLAGAFQFFARERWVWSPLHNRLWWQTMSHKALRLLVAPLQVIALGANVALASWSELYQFILLAQIAFYAGALAACLLPRGWKRPIAITFPYIFCLLSWATVIGFARWTTRAQSVTWDKATVTH